MRKFIALGTLFIIACGGGSAKKAAPPDGSVWTPTDTSVLSPLPSSVLACSQVAPSVCGGNIVGTWEMIGFCNPGKTQADVIASYSKYSQCGNSADMKLDGYAKFRADGTFQINEKDSFIVRYPESCLKDTAVECAKIGVDVCASDGTMCTCTFVPPYGTTAGYYSTANSQYHLITYDGDTLDRPYCVQGNVLSIFAPSDSIFGGGVVVLNRIADSDVADVDAGPLPGVKYDAAPDVPADGPGSKDAALDKPKADAGIPDASLEAPRQDAAIDKPKADAPVIDASPVDTQPIDTAPLPLGSMVPSSVPACQQEAAAPCGGDLTGSWNIIGTCDPWLSETEFLSQVNKTCNTAADFIESGSAVFSVDGNCSLDYKQTFQIDYGVSCLSSKSGQTCSAKDTQIKKEIGANDMTAASCALASTTDCRCSNTNDTPPTEDACTYKIKGNVVTFVSPPGFFSAGGFEYCVQGNTLTIFINSTSDVGASCADCYAGFVLVRATN